MCLLDGTLKGFNPLVCILLLATKEDKTCVRVRDLEEHIHSQSAAIFHLHRAVSKVQGSSVLITSAFREGGVIRGEGGVIRGKGGVIKGEEGVIRGEGGVIRGKGGVIKGEEGVIRGKGGVIRGKGGVIRGKGGVIRGEGGVIRGEGRREVSHTCDTEQGNSLYRSQHVRSTIYQNV